jgi:hypothetical protein
MGSRRSLHACTVLCSIGALLAAGEAGAQVLGAASTPAGASFSSACAGLGFAGGGNPGDNVERVLEGSSATCQATTSAVGGSASTSASASGTSDGIAYANAAKGSVAANAIHLKATNASSQQAAFPGGETNAGFSAQITIPTPTSVSGTTGI